MQNLPMSYRQKDKPIYQSITLEGSANYEWLYMSGEAKDEAAAMQGIPADDFNVFATLVFALKDRNEKFDAIRSNGRVRHIDAGTGPNLYTFIASLPYADELMSVDLTPANVARVEAIVKGKQPLAAHWLAWGEIAVILYDLGSADTLIELDHDSPALYDQLRHYPTLAASARKKLQGDIAAFVGGAAKQRNPYVHLDIKAELAKKLRPHVGDILDDVAPLEELVGTADIYTRVFFSESIDDTLQIVAHAETNGIQFAKPGAFTMSAHMTKTAGYKGFFTPQELAADTTKKLAELPATPKFFEALLGEIVELTDDYRQLWSGLEDNPKERKMVRQDMAYGGVVILCGDADYKRPDGTNKYENGLELLRRLDGTLRTITVPEVPHQRMHCTVTDMGSAIDELTASHFLSGGSEVTIRVQRPAAG